MEDGSILTKLNSQLKLLSAIFSCVRIAVVFSSSFLGIIASWVVGNSMIT